MMGCRHHYEWRHGKFVCIYCGHKHYPTHAIKRYITRASILVTIVVVGFFVYQNIEVVTQKVQEQIAQIDIPQYIENIPNPNDANKVTHTIPLTTTTDEHGRKVTVVGEETIEYGNNKLVILELELQIHNLLNSERESRGLQPLAFDTKLASIAREHSKDMSSRNFFAHENPEGQDPTDRGLQAGYRCHKELGGGYYTEGIAENIFQNNLYDSYTQSGIYTSYDWNTPEEIAQSTVDGWMHSSGHRQNILTKTYDRQGIGVAVSGDSQVYITEDFC